MGISPRTHVRVLVVSARPILRQRIPVLACALAFLLSGTHAHAAAAITIENPTTASGGGVVEEGDIRLAYTLGEPAAGRISAGPWTIVSGFLPTIVLPQLGDAVFSDSFESPDAP